MKGAAFDAVLSTHWAIEESWLSVITALAQRWRDAPEVLALRQARPLQNAKRATVLDGVAVIPITGPIFPRANMMTEMSGATSLNMTALDFGAALADADVKAIILDIDSPGGVASGIGEFAAQVFAARGVKPIAAYVGGLGASAAYWIATAAGEVVASPSALLGSIGVRTAIPVQETNDLHGYRLIDIVSTNAADKAPDPRTDAGRAVIRAALDGIEREFIDDLARHRGVGADAVRAEFGRGAVVPARDAVARRMADRIGSFDSTLAELVARTSAPPPAARRAASAEGEVAPTASRSTPLTLDPAAFLRAAGVEADAKLPQSSGRPAAEGMGPARAADSMAAAAASTEEKTMTTPAGAPVQPAAITAESIARDHPTIAAHFRAEGAAAERARIIAVQEQGLPGHEALTAAFVADGKTTPDEAARAMVSAERRMGRAVLGAFVEDSKAIDAAAPAAPAPSGPSAATLAAMPVEERCKAEWERSPELRAEFGTLDRYTAFKRADARGLVRRVARVA